MRNLPFQGFAENAVWLALVLTAQDLLAWTQRLCLTGDAQRWEPKRLRYRLLHVAGRLARSGRRVTLHLQRSWPWVHELLRAFNRFARSPQPADPSVTRQSEVPIQRVLLVRENASSEHTSRRSALDDPAHVRLRLCQYRCSLQGTHRPSPQRPMPTLTERSGLVDRDSAFQAANNRMTAAINA